MLTLTPKDEAALDEIKALCRASSDGKFRVPKVHPEGKSFKDHPFTMTQVKRLVKNGNLAGRTVIVHEWSGPYRRSFRTATTTRDYYEFEVI